MILAGGLGPDNVQEAIRSVQPAGVDSKTKTDSEGTHSKDLVKVEAFHRAAKSGQIAFRFCGLVPCLGLVEKATDLKEQAEEPRADCGDTCRRQLAVLGPPPIERVAK